MLNMPDEQIGQFSRHFHSPRALEVPGKGRHEPQSLSRLWAAYVPSKLWHRSKGTFAKAGSNSLVLIGRTACDSEEDTKTLALMMINKRLIACGFAEHRQIRIE
jgi:hypothetical protein